MVILVLKRITCKFRIEIQSKLRVIEAQNGRLFVDKEYWVIVDHGTTPIGMVALDQKKLDKKENIIIWLFLSNLELLNVTGQGITKELLDKLGAFHQFKSLLNKIFLQNKLYLLRMNDGDPMIEHIDTFKIIVIQLLFADIKFSDQDKCISIPCSFLDS